VSSRWTTTGCVDRTTTSPAGRPAGAATTTSAPGGSATDSSPPSATDPAGPTCSTLNTASSGVTFSTSSASERPGVSPDGALQVLLDESPGAPATMDVPVLPSTRRVTTCSTTTPGSSDSSLSDTFTA